MSKSSPSPAPTLSGCDQERYAKEFLPLVRVIAKEVQSKLLAHVPLDDLVSAGHLGLTQALKRWSSHSTASISTFVKIRIRGAILDELRAIDPAPRAVRTLMKKSEVVRSQLRLRLGREPVQAELEVIVPMTAKQRERCRRVPTLVTLNSQAIANQIRQIPDPSTGLTQSDQVLEVGDRVRVGRVWENLSERDQQILRWCYIEGRSLQEVAGLLGTQEGGAFHARLLALRHIRQQFLQVERPPFRLTSLPASV